MAKPRDPAPSVIVVALLALASAGCNCAGDRLVMTCVDASDCAGDAVCEARVCHQKCVTTADCADACAEPNGAGSSCNHGVCRTGCDPCANVVCNSPPPSVCEDGYTLRLYQEPGRCSQGVCRYEATSLAELAKAIGVHKPSLYGAFGDKRALYFQAYDAYQRDASMLVASALSKHQVKDALTAFFDSDLDLFTAEAGLGCFMLATALPIASTDAEMAERIRAALIGLRSAFVGRLRQADAQREISPHMPVETAAELLLSTHIALANRSRSGEPRKSLEKIAGDLIGVICRR